MAIKNTATLSETEKGVRIRELLSQRILFLDGAMGTMIQRYKLNEADFREGRFEDHHIDLKGNNELLVLTRPYVITEIHKAFLAGGADIIETNSFSSTSIAQADYELESIVYEQNVTAARLARRAVDEFVAENPDRECFVAGALGPTNRTASLSPDVNRPDYRAVSFDHLKDAYSEQIRALAEGGQYRRWQASPPSKHCRMPTRTAATGTWCTPLAHPCLTLTPGSTTAGMRAISR